MSRSDFTKFTKEVNSKLGNIIVTFNFLERKLKEILALYIKSERNEFVTEIFLHNSTIPIGTKLNLLKFILKKEKIQFKVEDQFHSLINMRNAVAHSDNLFNLEGDIIGEEEIDAELGLTLPIYFPYIDGPKITIYKNGKIDEKGLDTLHNEYKEKLAIVEEELKSIEEQIKNTNPDPVAKG